METTVSVQEIQRYIERKVKMRRAKAEAESESVEIISTDDATSSTPATN